MPPALIRPPGLSPSMAAEPHRSPITDTAILAESLVSNFRLGRMGKRGHVVQLRVEPTSDQSFDVDLREEDGSLVATLTPLKGDAAMAERMAAAFDKELRQRSSALDIHHIEVRVNRF